MANRRAGLAFIFITLLIDVMGFGLIIPVLPKLVTTLAGGGASNGAHVFGLLLSVYGLMQFLFAPVLGSLSDRYGRRPVLLVSLFFTAVDFLIMAVAPTIGWLFIGRTLSGITGASYTAASAYIADVSPPEKRAQSFGLLGAAFGLGFILGPAVGGLLGGISIHAPFWAAMVLTIINGLYGFFVLPESLAPENRRPLSLKLANPIGGFQVLARYRWVLLLTGALALQGLAQQSLQSVWVLYTTYRFHWTPLYNGYALAFLGVASAVVQMLLIRVAVAKIGEKRCVLLGMLLNGLGFFAFALSTQGWMMIAVMLVWSLSGIAGPTTQSLVSHQYGEQEQGTVQGALTSLQSLMGIVGPLMATWVFGYFTSSAAPFQQPGAPFFLGALLIALGLILAFVALRTSQRSAS